jgi:IPT/TIG domain
VTQVRLAAFAMAACIVVVIGLVVAVAAKQDGGRARGLVSRLITGADGRLSTSKFQWFLWTLVTLFGFCAVFIERMLSGEIEVDPSVPTNLLIAMGLSATTMTAAKGITTLYVDQGLIDKAVTETVDARTSTQKSSARGGLVTDDHGMPDLSKIQMVSFTLIAIAIYLIRLGMQSSPPILLDIDPALMVLMGLSQGAYLGKKLTTKESPRITGMSPAIGNVAESIKLTGTNFGDAQSGSFILVDGTPAPEVSAWSDKELTFSFPRERSPGVLWKNGDRATVGLVVNGRDATTPVQFVVRTEG